MTALGMIEVRGYLGAVSVADTALKAANVTLNNAEVIRGGITTIQLTGDVAAV
ncbi:MAG: BMC domain-containing protein, partial [Enterococcus avium]|nr:BMC domain-containing protein [Enterococcus avium]